MQENQSEYRYDVNEQTGQIFRGRAYRLPDDWTTESWRHYWDGDWAVAFTVDYGVRLDVYAQNDSEDTERAIEAWKKSRNYGDVETHGKDAMDRLAYRLTGRWDARFISVGLERGMDLYALSWDGDPDGEWRDEIEAVNWGDIYRIETCEWVAGRWLERDEYPDQWYGYDKALEALHEMFGLPEFPAERLVSEAMGA